MFERFTERARQVVVLAQDEARTLKHNYIGTEHLLLGLLREEEGVAARVLAALGVTQEAARAQVAATVGLGTEIKTGQVPFTSRAKEVLELALREALSLGHNYIGTEHILLGMVRENGGVGARVLGELGADPEGAYGPRCSHSSRPGPPLSATTRRSSSSPAPAAARPSRRSPPTSQTPPSRSGRRATGRAPDAGRRGSSPTA